MPSLRNVKKDINYLTYEVISDCYTFMYLHPDEKQEKAESIILEMIDVRNDLIMRVNNVNSKDRKEIKTHFKNIYKDLLAEVDKSFKNLSELTK